MSINCTKDVIKKVDIAILINCPCKLDALFLTPTEIDPSLTYFSLITKIHHFQILFQAASIYDL